MHLIKVPCSSGLQMASNCFTECQGPWRVSPVSSCMSFGQLRPLLARRPPSKHRIRACQARGPQTAPSLGAQRAHRTVTSMPVML
jgi:hypothetical protein